MGTTDSKEEENAQKQQNNLFSEQGDQNDWTGEEFYKNLESECYGKAKLMRKQMGEGGKYCVVLERITQDQGELVIIWREAERRKTLLSGVKQIAQFLEIQKFKQEEYCGQFYRLSARIEYIPFTLSDEIRNRKSARLKFREDEIISMISEVIKGIQALKNIGVSHDKIQPKTILVGNKSEDKVSLSNYKIVDLSLFSCDEINSEYVQFMLGCQQDCYLSPELLNCLYHRQLIPQHDKDKSQIFSVGLCAIEMALLQSIQQIYDFDNYSVSNEVLSGLISQIGQQQQYSKRLIDTISSMVDLNQKNRMSFYQLEQVYQLGNRNSQSNQNLVPNRQNQEIMTNVSSPIDLNKRQTTYNSHINNPSDFTQSYSQKYKVRSHDKVNNSNPNQEIHNIFNSKKTSNLLSLEPRGGDMGNLAQHFDEQNGQRDMITFDNQSEVFDNKQNNTAKLNSNNSSFQQDFMRSQFNQGIKPTSIRHNSKQNTPLNQSYQQDGQNKNSRIMIQTKQQNEKPEFTHYFSPLKIQERDPNTDRNNHLQQDNSISYPKIRYLTPNRKQEKINQEPDISNYQVKLLNKERQPSSSSSGNFFIEQKEGMQEQRAINYQVNKQDDEPSYKNIINLEYGQTDCTPYSTKYLPLVPSFTSLRSKSAFAKNQRTQISPKPFQISTNNENSSGIYWDPRKAVKTIEMKKGFDQQNIENNLLNVPATFNQTEKNTSLSLKSTANKSPSAPYYSHNSTSQSKFKSLIPNENYLNFTPNHSFSHNDTNKCDMSMVSNYDLQDIKINPKKKYQCDSNLQNNLKNLKCRIEQIDNSLTSVPQRKSLINHSSSNSSFYYHQNTQLNPSPLNSKEYKYQTDNILENKIYDGAGSYLHCHPYAYYNKNI